jgi:hypothetical protein
MSRDGESSDGEDSWYDRMEAEAFKNDTAGISDYQPTEENQQVPQCCESESAYFERVHEHNCKAGIGGFSSENDPTWNIMLNTAARESALTAKGQTREGHMILLGHADAASIILCKHWLFQHLPRSVKMYNEVCAYETCEEVDVLLFVDDVMHPMVSAMTWAKAKESTLEVSFFSPYNSCEIDFNPLFTTARSIISESKGSLTDVFFVGVDAVQYETAVSTNAMWHCAWIEYHNLMVYQEHFISGLYFSSLPDGYYIDDLR